MVVYRASKLLCGGQRLLEKSKLPSHNLMLANGYIHPIDKGLYAILPIGQRVIDKLIGVIENELKKLGAFKVSLPLLSSKDLWLNSGRWNKMSAEMFRVKDRSGKEYCVQPTAEEMITKLFSEMGVQRRSSFPIMLYQTNNKYRDEMRPKFGLFRSREFIMNDLYSFDVCKEEAVRTYQCVSEMYCHILRVLLGLDVIVVEADTGDIGGSISHEFHVPNAYSDQMIYYCKKCKKAVDATLFNRGQKPCGDCVETSITSVRSMEVAHTFQLGATYSKNFKALSSLKGIWMNCFGFGIGRIVSAAIDLFSKEKNAVRLPTKIAPFKVAVVPPSAATVGHNAASFAESLIAQIAETNNLRDDLFVDDRLNYSVRKRIQLASEIGIPHIFAIGSFTAKTLLGIPQIEYFQADKDDKTPRKVSDLNHRDVFEVVKNL